ncbi:MAG TPA: hypothetical protein VNK96_05550 [Fimbriimonadales bacterium]|nr:hypothetical protein [Fimbriimonadales bacterium]
MQMPDRPITINLFRDYCEDGPWLSVWHGVDRLDVREDGSLSEEATSRMRLAVEIERELRQGFVARARLNYGEAVKTIRSATLDYGVPIEILDRCIER